MNINEKLRDYLLGFGVLTLWSTFIQIIFVFLYPFDLGSQNLPDTLLGHIRLFVWAGIFAPFLEELLFRVSPIELMKETKLSERGIMFGIIISSFLFGMYHQMGYYSMLQQGVFGFISGLLYYKHGKYLWNVGLHSLWNFCLIWVFPLTM